MSKAVRRLFEQFQPSHYDLAIQSYPDSMTFKGTVVIQGKKTGRPSQRLTFHQKGLEISEATIRRTDKKGEKIFPVSRINLHKSYDEVRLHTNEQLYPGEYTVMLTFSGKIHEVMHGIYPCNYTVDGKAQKLIATQFESHHAREAFPCIDEPEAKATFGLILNTPAGDTALSNMPAIATHAVEGGRQATEFETTPRMSTYLLAFVHGELQSKEAKTKDGVVVRTWATKAHSSESLDYALDVATRAIEFFNEYYGVPYPLPKSDHIALPDFSVGAMENWGLITYRETCLIADPKTASQSSRELIALVVCHELSHQWFGNLVTMKWWDDLWLNESFADVMEFVAQDALFPDWHVFNRFITSDGLSALRRDSIAGVQSVKTPVNHPDEINTIFDPSIVYAKGGRLINMLRTYLGEDNFRAGLKAYFESHQYGNTTGADLWAALGEASGKDVAAFMNPWLERSGFPVVSVSQHEATLKLSQQHFLTDPTKIDTERVWPVPLLSDSKEVPVVLDTAATELTLPATKFVQINQGAVGHYIVNYTEPAHIADLAKRVSGKELAEAERLMLLSDSSLLARAGMQSFKTTLQLLEHYAAEDSEPVWDIIALILADARRFIDLDNSLEDPIKASIRLLVQKQYERLGWKESAGESVDDIKLRATILALGVYAGHEAITREALKLFTSYQEDPSSVPAELRSIVLGAAVRYESAGAFDYLLHLQDETNNVDLVDELTSVLTLTKDQAQIAMLLERVKDRSKVRPQDVDHWIAFLLRNRHAREQAWEWLQQSWSWIEETFGSDKSYDNFPRYAASAFNTGKLYESYQQFFGPMQDQIALARNITLGLEEIQNRVAWLERDLADVKAFYSAS